MGQKVNPVGIRIGITQNWRSRWYAKKDYAKNLHEDLKIRGFIKNRLKSGEISEVEIIRYPEKVNLIIHTARPGVVIGKKGAEIENLRKELKFFTDKSIQIKIKEIKNPGIDAKIIAQSIARQLESRISFRRAMKKSISTAMQAGARGVKVACSGRIGGAEMSRTEHYKEGMIPLHTFRADIDYGLSESNTTFGKIGVKVWVYKGEVFKGETREQAGTLIRKKRV